MKRLFTSILAAVLCSAVLSSCIPLAAGAAAGYVAHEKGYRLQSPVKKGEKEVD